MIAKNIKGKSFKGCVRYVMNDTAKLLEAEGVLAGTAEEIIRSFAMQRSGRKEIKQPVGHIPVSFAPEDKGRMTNDFMVQLAKEYMQEMGIRNTQYIIARHDNTGNPHLHIVYNRIDNDLKLISVNHDYKRNVKVCKKLKDRHGLTYGQGKERVKREKLRNPDAAKYLLYDIIKTILPYCTNEKKFQDYLQNKGINVEFKQRRTTGEIEGISFRYDEIAFKGSEVLTNQHPETFVKYGKYEMRLMDKMRIEAGCVTNAKVKWYGIGTFAYPYLWKENQSDPDYKEAWGDPGLPKVEQTRKQQNILKNPKISRGRKR